MLARPGMTFRMLEDAINDAFARWDLSHLHAFTLADGTRITLKGPWDEDWNESELDDTREKLTRLSLGEQFVSEFDFGDGWMHLCTVADEKVDPHEVYGEAPDRPVAYFGWGAIPDQTTGAGTVMMGRNPLTVAHLAGPGLIHAVEVGHDPAGVIIHRLLPRLRDRRWLGDDELASHLDGPTDFYRGWKLEIATGRAVAERPVGDRRDRTARRLRRSGGVPRRRGSRLEAGLPRHTGLHRHGHR